MRTRVSELVANFPTSPILNMQHYLEAIILETIERAKRLKTRFPTPPSLHFQALVQKCVTLIDENIAALNSLYYAPEHQILPNQSKRLRNLKIVIRDLDVIENVAVSAISRNHPDDTQINKIVQQICKEIHYPIPVPPTGSALSTNYYQIYPHFNLLCVPLLECDFLLHLPDLYHELAHPLFWTQNDSRISPFQEQAGAFYDMVLKHFDKVILEDQRNHGSGMVPSYDIWKKNWANWLIEFFCDIFGVCTAGPAYGWAHLHLAMKRGSNPFEVPLYSKSTHPNDEARMQVILYVLEYMHLTNAKDSIEKKWKEMKGIMAGQRNSSYAFAYPNELLKECALHGFRAVVNINSNIATNQTGIIFKTLNEAWDQYWKDPTSFSIWERKKVEEMYSIDLR